MTGLRSLLLGALLLAGLASAAGNAVAQDRFTVAVPRVPPHVFQSGEGRDTSSLRVLLECAGIRDPRFQVFTFPRHWVGFLVAGDIQAISTVPGDGGLVDPPKGGQVFFTEPYIQYVNGAITLAPLQVRSLSDLAGRRAISFVGGSAILPGLADAIRGMAAYRETGDQQVHSALLFSREVDAILADGLIVAEYNRRLAEEPKGALNFDPTQRVTFTPLFPPTPYRAAFRDRALRDRVNACLTQTPVKDRLAAIHRNYVERYRDVVGDRY